VEQYRPEFHQGGDDSRVLGGDDFLQHVMARTRQVVPQKIALDIPLDELLMSVSCVERPRSGLGLYSPQPRASRKS